MEVVAKFIAYILLIFITYKICIVHYKELNFSFLFRIGNKKNRAKHRTNIFIPLSLAIAWGFYSVWASNPILSGDRYAYTMKFVNHYENEWTRGVNALANFVHGTVDDVRMLFFLITFITVFILLTVVCNEYQGRKNIALFFVSSNLIISSFYLIKQAPAVTFGTLALVAVTKKRYFMTAVMIIVAILFHESALILIPLSILCVFRDRRIIRCACYLVMILIVLWFGLFSSKLYQLLQLILPDIAYDLRNYFNEYGELNELGHAMATLKGMPTYIITYVGFRKRKELSKKIENYNFYLLVCAVSTISIVLSVYLYWMFRFALYGMIISFTFAAKIIEHTRDRKTAFYLKYSVVAVSLLINLRYIAQIYFLYGGF